MDDISRKHPFDLDVLKSRFADAKAGRLSWTEVNKRRVSPILEYLPYLDIHTMFLMPLNHALLMGIVANFVDYLFKKCDKLVFS
jgi:hypothetical protein